MDRKPPRATSDELDLYIRTYYSLLRSSGGVRVRAFEEAHMYSRSSLHSGARDATPDVAAFAYSAARLPDCMPDVKLLVLGQSKEQFEAAGFAVRDWRRVVTRGRRRPMRWDGKNTLACFVTSTSDIDDLVPIVTAYQIEWNKMHHILSQRGSLDESVVSTLHDAFGSAFDVNLATLRAMPLDLSMRLLSGSFVEYQRAAHRWWSEIEPHYTGGKGLRRPVYIVSSNTHALVNLLGGYALNHLDRIRQFARERNPENLASHLEGAIAAGDEAEVANCSYYLLHKYLNDGDQNGRRKEVQSFDAQSGITTILSPGHIDVATQLFDIARLIPQRLDPRLRNIPGLDLLKRSDAFIVNIDYPLGMAAYHHLSRVAQAVGEIRGVYVMGKAATLNGRVGDVMVSGVAYDEHSSNTFLFDNCFRATNLQPYVKEATVLDGQKTLTVRGSFLQNREYMGTFYREGYTVLEMEAGPYLSAIFEMVNPKRHPKDEIVHLSTMIPFDFGLLHYASDTPYSRRQSLLSKSLSYFGVEATYGCATGIARQILDREIARLSGIPTGSVDLS